MTAFHHECYQIARFQWMGNVAHALLTLSLVTAEQALGLWEKVSTDKACNTWLYPYHHITFTLKENSTP